MNVGQTSVPKAWLSSPNRCLGKLHQGWRWMKPFASKLRSFHHFHPSQSSQPSYPRCWAEFGHIEGSSIENITESSLDRRRIHVHGSDRVDLSRVRLPTYFCLPQVEMCSQKSKE